MPFKVLVADNFHYMDESETYELGVFATADEAIAAAQRVVDDYLHSAYIPAMTEDALWRSYASFGEDPAVIAIDAIDSIDAEKVVFSAWDYARRRCAALCNPP